MSERPIDTDILIVGGGIQGVTLLHQLVAAGARRVLLASAGDLGEGETLHSHGYMHHGYAMSAAGSAVEPLVRELGEAAAWWRDRLRPPYAPGPPVYHCLPADAAPQRIGFWDRFGIAYRAIADAPDPLRDGEADSGNVRLFSIDDRLVSMRDILTEMATPLQERIVEARLTSIELEEGGGRVASCRLGSKSGDILVRPGMLLLATGRETQPLLRAARTPSGDRPLESRCAGLNRIRFVPMLLMRGARLPQISGLFESHALSLLTHPVAGDESIWILTLMQGHETERGDFDREKENTPGGPVVAESLSRLKSLVPEARRRLETDLRFSFYFGGKIDHPGGGNARYAEDCGIANLRVAWPGVWSLSCINAARIVSDLRSSTTFSGMLDPARTPLDLEKEKLTTGAAVGEELRLSPARIWHRWTEFASLQGIG